MAEQYNPYFIDSDGNEAHIGDFVSWTETKGNCGRKLRSGRVLDISYRTSANGCDGSSVSCLVRVSGKSQNMQANTLTKLTGDTLIGKLESLVASCEGRMDEDAIAATAAEIEEMFAPEDDPEGVDAEG